MPAVTPSLSGVISTSPRVLMPSPTGTKSASLSPPRSRTTTICEPAPAVTSTAPSGTASTPLRVASSSSTFANMPGRNQAGASST